VGGDTVAIWRFRRNVLKQTHATTFTLGNLASRGVDDSTTDLYEIQAEQDPCSKASFRASPDDERRLQYLNDAVANLLFLAVQDTHNYTGSRGPWRAPLRPAAPQS
jgi:hypothetical protein